MEVLPWVPEPALWPDREYRWVNLVKGHFLAGCRACLLAGQKEVSETLSFVLHPHTLCYGHIPTEQKGYLCFCFCFNLNQLSEYKLWKQIFWSLYAGQEATVRTGHRTTDWFQIGKGICQGCILSPCRVHHEKRWAGRSTRSNQDCQEKYQ